ncbi:cytochrome P450 [Spirillospora sp. CA-255316]
MTQLTVPALTDPDLYTRGDPHAVWAEMRRERPVHWYDSGFGGQEPFWAVTAFEAAHQVLTDWRTFSSTRGTLLRPNLSDPFPGQGTMLTLTDPPRHTVLRRVLSGLFTPRAVARFEERAREATGALIDAALEAGTCDFVADIGAGLLLAVASDLLGVEPGDADHISALARVASENIGDLEGAAAQAAHLEILTYCARAVERRRREPRDDIVTALIEAERGGLDISLDETVLTCDNVIFAATETARHAAASGLLSLLENPAEMRALRRGEAGFDAAVEEILRYHPSVTHLLRTATTATTLMGERIEAGQPVTVWIPAANRDARVHEHADEFRAGRHPNRHLTFGGGMHFCLGAALTRQLLRVLFEELLHRTRAISLAGPPRRIRSFATAGLDSLPIALQPR